MCGLSLVVCGSFSRCVRGLSLVVLWGTFSSCAVCGSFSSCGARASLVAACGILVPRPGIEPMFPALGGRFSPTGPQGKSPLLSSKLPEPSGVQLCIKRPRLGPVSCWIFPLYLWSFKLSSSTPVTDMIDLLSAVLIVDTAMVNSSPDDFFFSYFQTSIGWVIHFLLV